LADGVKSLFYRVDSVRNRRFKKLAKTVYDVSSSCKDVPGSVEFYCFSGVLQKLCKVQRRNERSPLRELQRGTGERLLLLQQYAGHLL